jgi:hypothetical protein
MHSPTDEWMKNALCAKACDWTLGRIMDRLRVRSATAVLPAACFPLMEEVSRHMGRPDGFMKAYVLEKGSVFHFVREFAADMTHEISTILHSMEDAICAEWNQVRNKYPDRHAPRIHQPRPLRAHDPLHIKPCLKRDAADAEDGTVASSQKKRIRIRTPVMCDAYPRLAWMVHQAERAFVERSIPQLPSPFSVIDKLHTLLDCPIRFSLLVHRSSYFVFECIAHYSFLITQWPQKDEVYTCLCAIVLRCMFLAMHMTCRALAPYPLNMQTWYSFALSQTPDCRAIWLLFQYEDIVVEKKERNNARHARGMEIVRQFLTKKRGVNQMYTVFERSTSILIGDTIPALCSERTINKWIYAMCIHISDELDQHSYACTKKEIEECKSIAEQLQHCTEDVWGFLFSTQRSTAPDDAQSCVTRCTSYSSGE